MNVNSGIMDYKFDYPCLSVLCTGDNLSASVFPGERVKGTTPRGGLHTPIFDRPSDWDREIKRTGASEWRVCAVNESYAISQRFSAHAFCSGQYDGPCGRSVCVAPTVGLSC